MQSAKIEVICFFFSMTGIESKAQEYAANLEEVRTEVFTEVTSNIQNAQVKQKLYYMYACTNRILAVRSRPLRNMRNLARKGGKLGKEWSGPYAIDKLCGKGLYRMRVER